MKNRKYHIFILIYKDKKINMNQKNLKISEKLHKDIKIFCANNSLKINDWVEKQLEEKINQIKNENKMD